MVTSYNTVFNSYFKINSPVIVQYVSGQSESLSRNLKENPSATTVKKKQENIDHYNIILYYLQFVYVVPLELIGAKSLKFGKDDTVDPNRNPLPFPATRPAEEVNNATARVQTKKPPALPTVPVIQWSDATLRAGVAAIQRGRARAAYPSAAAAAAAAAAFARHPTPLTAGSLHGYTPVLNTLPVEGGVYYDPFLAAHAADQNYSRLQAAAAAAAATPLLKTPLSTAQQASYAAAASYTAVAARYGAAAAAQPVAGYAAVAGYGRDYGDPYLGHGIGPITGYGMYRSSYNRFTPY
uniref:RNA binding protein fox-1 homolog 2-like n=1 Tax=Diabrotica virgifera virgifera TaxID=50390 RepID=A0A6P7GB45_DIAVI